jgi:hypothetical protein
MSFVPNKNADEELAAEPKYKDGLAGMTENAAVAARAFAPVRTGAYRDSIQTVVQDNKIYLSAGDFKAFWIEYGTAAHERRAVGTPIFAPLRRGVTAVGLKFAADK